MASDLEFRDISHAYDGVPRVREVSFTVEAGTIACLLGPSGCGKTTLLRLAAGLESVQFGRIMIGGHEVASERVNVPPEYRHVGLMFQDYALFPHLTVHDNVGFGLRDMAGSERRARVVDALERVGMQTAARSFPHSLSGGEQQRVALARAMAPRPAVMLLDEPFSSLDAQLRTIIRRDTAALLADMGTTTLMVTHDPAEAADMADHVALMRAGRILQQGTMAQLYNHPETAFCAEFLGEINRLDGRVVDRHAETAIGRFAVGAGDGYEPGAAVQVLVRPEGLRPLRAADDKGARARVSMVRRGGPLQTVRMRLVADGHELTARTPAGQTFAIDDEVAIQVDPAMVFVFPRGDR